MAPASPPAAAPTPTSRARRALPAAATVLGVAALLRLVYDAWYLNYDARYALLWARDAARGDTPDYTADFAPTPHPLETAASVLALPFGEGAADVMAWVVALCFGACVWLVFRLGSELFAPAAGAVAALVVLTRPMLLRDALLGYQDMAFAALILGAVLLELRRPRRGWPIVAMLVVAGLMRPEAWALAGLYVLWLWPAREWRARIGLAALAAVSPLLWSLADYAVTGDFLHSLHGTADLAEAAGRRRHLHQAPYWTAAYFGSTLREPLAVGIPIGLAFAWAHRDRFRRAALPLAVAAAMTLVFMAGPVFGLPLIGRYVRTPAMLLALFYGLAVVGWTLLARDDRRRRAWLIAGAVAALASIAFLPWHGRMLANQHAKIERDADLYRDLRAAA
ncbi:MAG TPA: hypothetical protein VM266_10655, partial [Solirubrobacteraceae bacterium]|nr:hypothetical protein [Solirubrobacteraceae bacterium]